MSDYKTIAKNIPGISEWDLKMGVEGLRYLRKRTHENPFFAIATGALHSGPISYDYQQKYVEKISEMNPHDFTNEKFNERALYKAQFWRTKSKTLADATKCYLKHCGERCLQEQGREDLLGCIKHEVRGIGKKTQDLMREYLRDDDAVAVDRHVMNWTCNVANLCYVNEIEKGGHIRDDQYKKMKEMVQDVAHKNKLTPAKLQVAIWMNGACQVAKRKHLWLGEGKAVLCGHKNQKLIDEFL